MIIKLSEELRQQIMMGMFDYSKSAFVENKPYNFIDLEYIYKEFSEKVGHAIGFDVYDFHDIIFAINSDTFEIGWNGQIDGEFFSAFIIYNFNDFTEDIDTIFLVDQDGDERSVSI